MIKEYLTALVALVAQISGLISILGGIGLFMGAADAKNIVLIAATVFLVSFIVTTKIKGGISWLISWSMPYPF